MTLQRSKIEKRRKLTAMETATALAMDEFEPEFIAAFEVMANLATRVAVEGSPIRIIAPLIDLSKQDIIRTGVRLGVDYAITTSCYQADAAGRACGLCESCVIRRSGFIEAGLTDPTAYA